LKSNDELDLRITIASHFGEKKTCKIVIFNNETIFIMLGHKSIIHSLENLETLYHLKNYNDISDRNFGAYFGSVSIYTFIFFLMIPNVIGT
jgi:hypothetical protein